MCVMHVCSVCNILILYILKFIIMVDIHSFATPLEKTEGFLAYTRSTCTGHTILRTIVDRHRWTRFGWNASVLNDLANNLQKDTSHLHITIVCGPTKWTKPTTPPWNHLPYRIQQNDSVRRRYLVHSSPPSHPRSIMFDRDAFPSAPLLYSSI